MLAKFPSIVDRFSRMVVCTWKATEMFYYLSGPGAYLDEDLKKFSWRRQKRHGNTAYGPQSGGVRAEVFKLPLEYQGPSSGSILPDVVSPQRKRAAALFNLPQRELRRQPGGTTTPSSPGDSEGSHVKGAAPRWRAAPAPLTPSRSRTGFRRPAAATVAGPWASVATGQADAPDKEA